MRAFVSTLIKLILIAGVGAVPFILRYGWMTGIEFFLLVSLLFVVLLALVYRKVIAEYFRARR